MKRLLGALQSATRDLCLAAALIAIGTGLGVWLGFGPALTAVGAVLLAIAVFGLPRLE